MEVLLWSLYGTTVLMWVPRRSWRRRGDPTADWPNPRWHCGSFEHVQSFRRAPANVRRFDCFPRCYGDQSPNHSGPRRSWRCHCGLCRTSTAVAPRLRCDGTSTAEARQNMFKVAAVPPRRSAVLTVFRGATTNNDGTTAEPRRSWRCHCGLCRTSTAVAPCVRCHGGISRANVTWHFFAAFYDGRPTCIEATHLPIT